MKSSRIICALIVQFNSKKKKKKVECVLGWEMLIPDDNKASVGCAH